MKNIKLKTERGICFEDVIVAISEGKLHDVIAHKNPAKYPNQYMYIVEMENYIHVVPFVRSGEKIFLKTIYPSRVLHKKYLKGES